MLLKLLSISWLANFSIKLSVGGAFRGLSRALSG
jgi:hypothetical protein